ncbi:uncharacterized protein B0I36DRAFT_388328 [Microdochium trichocladiopsis]|uniref:Uncharacterized protein n=1 Tax=Microdochium trichocladiopsis TaxID=1682393 RepID=A0A9P8XUB3_9PEZI|nr:uncharacterized protein B0I36DRAFT_388328 [Microdochium trichocladiopsis]KAH7018040.1 hypothetical protein B0I36DRAFT_388328 [Microdochium trichocladiopsis]
MLFHPNPLVLAATFLGLVSASPLDARAADPLCVVVTKAVSLLKQQAAATQYCASYLSITTPPAVVQTVYVASPTTVTVSYLLNCETTPAPAKRHDPAGSEPKHAREAPDGAPRAAPHLGQHHDERAVAKPACLSAFNVASAISSACNCLAITTPTASTSIASLLAHQVTSTTTTTVLETSYTFKVYDENNRFAKFVGGDATAPEPFAFVGTSDTATKFNFFFSLGTGCIMSTSSFTLIVPGFTANDGGGLAFAPRGTTSNQQTGETVLGKVERATGKLTLYTSTSPVFSSESADSNNFWNVWRTAAKSSQSGQVSSNLRVVVI